MSTQRDEQRGMGRPNDVLAKRARAFFSNLLFEGQGEAEAANAGGSENRVPDDTPKLDGFIRTIPNLYRSTKLDALSDCK